MKISPNNSFEFTASGKDIAAAFIKINTMTQYAKADDTKYVIVVSDGKKPGIFMIGTSTDAMGCIEIKGEVKKAGVVRVDASALTGLLKARQEMIFKAENGKIAFKEKKGRYTGQLDVAEFDEEDVRLLTMQFGNQDVPKFNKELVSTILKVVKKVHLTDFYQNSELQVVVQVTDKEFRALCFDPFHIAVYREKLKSKLHLDISLPIKAFAVIEKFTGTGDLSMSVSGGRFHAVAEDCRVSIPISQLDDDLKKQPLHYLKVLKDIEPRNVLTFDTKACAAISNMAVLTDNETKMALSVGKNDVSISVKGKGGMASDSFSSKVKGKPIEMRVDPRLFMDLFNKVKEDEIAMELYKIPGAASTFKIRAKLDDGMLTMIGTYDEAK